MSLTDSLNNLPVGDSTLGAVLATWRAEHPDDDAAFMANLDNERLLPPRPPSGDDVCPGCKGYGNKVWDTKGPNDPLFGKTVPCSVCADQRHAELAIKLMQHAGIDAMSRYTRESFLRVGGDPNLLTQADEWRKCLRESPGGLYLYGNVGRGKSWLASELVRSWIVEVAQPARFLSVPKWLQSLRPGGHTSEEEKALARNTAMTVPMLVMDDVGAERPSSWVLETLYEVVEERKALRLPTIYTSNMDPEALEILWTDQGLSEFDRQQGLRIMERMLWDHCDKGRWVIDVKGLNLRRVAA